MTQTDLDSLQAMSNRIDKLQSDLTQLDYDNYRAHGALVDGNFSYFGPNTNEWIETTGRAVVYAIINGYDAKKAGLKQELDSAITAYAKAKNAILSPAEQTAQSEVLTTQANAQLAIAQAQSAQITADAKAKDAETQSKTMLSQATQDANDAKAKQRTMIIYIAIGVAVLFGGAFAYFKFVKKD